MPTTLVYGDPGRIRQVLNKLVGNAVKFTHQGRVIVHSSIQQVNESEVTLKCVVSDTGVGISDDKFREMFEKFTQEDFSSTREYGGAGLGLSIAKQLCEQMGGSLDGSSVKNQGSEFGFHVPLQKVQPNDLK